MSLQWT